MIQTNIKLSLFLSLASCFLITGCSNVKNTKQDNDRKVKQPVTHRVEVETNKNKVRYSNLSDAWKLNHSSRLNTTIVPSPKSSKNSLNVNQKNNQRNTTARKSKISKVVIAKKRLQINPRLNSRRELVPKLRSANLTGDYKSNPRVVAFMKKMTRKHGFDPGYLNYIFSHTELTPFLARMAYRDAYGQKKQSKKANRGKWNRYRNNFVTKRTIEKGMQFWKQNRIALKQAELRYGVPQEYILGIIGVETRYGENVGKNKAIEALAAMGFENPRRGTYFQKELESYLLMTRKEGIDPLKPLASYAGALGLCQFMPSNIKRYGVDHDGNGHVNLWTAKDAIGSVANYFQKHGWRPGGTVAVPAHYTNSGYKVLKTGFKSSHSLARLTQKGISAAQLGNIRNKASLIKLNTYAGDELWLGGPNFYVITRYNHSSHYAMAVHQLAQAIKERIGGSMLIRQASLH